MKNKIIILAILILPKLVLAEVPLSLESVLTDKGKLKLEAGVIYSNSENDESKFSNPLLIQTGKSSFVAVPTQLNKQNNNTDILVGHLGLRYGLTTNTDIYTKVYYLWRNKRYFNEQNESNKSSHYVSGVLIGTSHTFLYDSKNPALIGFIESMLYQKINGNSALFKSWTVGINTYKTIDPIVLSLIISYSFNLGQNTGDGFYRMGNALALNPSVTFAVNDSISLTGGVQWVTTQGDKQNEKTITPKNTSTYLQMGVGWGVSKETILNASVQFKISGQGNAELLLSMTHVF